MSHSVSVEFQIGLEDKQAIPYPNPNYSTLPVNHHNSSTYLTLTNRYNKPNLLTILPRMRNTLRVSRHNHQVTQDPTSKQYSHFSRSILSFTLLSHRFLQRPHIYLPQNTNMHHKPTSLAQTLPQYPPRDLPTFKFLDKALQPRLKDLRGA